MKKILVTGAGGFIGSHLAERCVELGYKVKAFLRYNSRNAWGWLENSNVLDDIEVVCGDIRDFDSVFSAMEGVDTVFHLAALIAIPYSYVSPLAYMKTNIEGTYNVLQSAKMLSTHNIMITSTSETYGTAQYVPIDEKHPAVGQSPYAATKISADQLATSFFYSFGMPIKIVRPFNTYGPRQSARAFIPTVITQILGGNKKITLGNIHPTRDLTYVKDTVNGFMEIFKSGNLFGEATNIGMKKEIPMHALAKKIAELMKADIEFEIENQRIRPDGSEVERLCCDNSKLLQHTNWKAEFSLDAGLKETIGWFKKHKSLYKASIYNM
jgi:NAD dependent epimerase/dehydratase